MKGLSRLNKSLRRVRRRLKPAAVILMYHRIVDVPLDPRGTAVSPSNLVKHLEYVRETCYPISLLDLVRALQGQSLPRRAVAVTFDDNYTSNLTQAYPLLTSEQIPATVFVDTGSINGSCFWWDELDRVLLLTAGLPDRLRLRLQEVEHEWPTARREEREQAHQTIRYLLRAATVDERERVIRDLTHWAQLEGTRGLDDRPMTSDELARLAQDGLVELGAHTITHPVLSALSTRAQFEEIVGSRQALEAITGCPVRTFAYPYGEASDFTQETTDIARASGFSAACTAIPGVVEPGDDIFQLRRCAVRNWDIGAFQQKLESFILG